MSEGYPDYSGFYGGLASSVSPAQDMPRASQQKETDEDLRARLLYLAGDGEQARHRILIAGGTQLDEIANNFGLRRL